MVVSRSDKARGAIMPAEQFQAALRRLMTDSQYCRAVEREPETLLSDYTLTSGEVGLLHAVREASGGEPLQVGLPDPAAHAQAAESGLMLCSWFACCCCEFGR
jgi:hypothetical protein